MGGATEGEIRTGARVRGDAKGRGVTSGIELFAAGWQGVETRLERIEAALGAPLRDVA